MTVTLAEVRDLGLPKRFAKNKMHLVEWLQQKYPSHQWDKMFTMTGRYGQQRRLEQAVTSLFPVYNSPSPNHEQLFLRIKFLPFGLTGNGSNHQCKEGGGAQESFNWGIFGTGCLYSLTQSSFWIPSMYYIYLINQLLTSHSLLMKERQHYTRDNIFSIIPLAEQQGRDKMKQELTSKNGITLVIVPCWWDRQLERFPSQSFFISSSQHDKHT